MTMDQIIYTLRDIASTPGSHGGLSPKHKTTLHNAIEALETLSAANIKYYEFQTSNYNRTIYYNNYYTSREVATPEIQSTIEKYKEGYYMGHYEHLREIPYKEYKQATECKPA
jgi:hypothetical protein